MSLLTQQRAFGTMQVLPERELPYIQKQRISSDSIRATASTVRDVPFPTFLMVEL